MAAPSSASVRAGSGFAQIGIAREKPAVATREAIELIRLLWRSTGDVEYQGQVITWRKGRLEFTCRPDIPIVIAARGPRLLEVAGEVADGAIIATGVTEGGVEWARERIRAGERRAGRPEGSVELLHMTYISIDADAARARQAVKAGILGAVSGSHPTYDFLRANGLEVPPALYIYLDSGAHDPQRILELIPDDMVEKLAIADPWKSAPPNSRRSFAPAFSMCCLRPSPSSAVMSRSCWRRLSASACRSCAARRGASFSVLWWPPQPPEAQ